MKRRELLIGSVVLWASTGVAAPDIASPSASSTDAWLHESVSVSALPRSPGMTGALSDPHGRLLGGFFEYLGDRWRLPASASKKATLFDDLLLMKTSATPSYLTEYREAATVLLALTGMGLSTVQAYERLIGLAKSGRPDESSRLGRAHKFVTAEFIAWLMAKDGYARFGYQNYRGLMAGSFALKPPPYRHL